MPRELAFAVVAETATFEWRELVPGAVDNYVYKTADGEADKK